MSIVASRPEEGGVIGRRSWQEKLAGKFGAGTFDRPWPDSHAEPMALDVAVDSAGYARLELDGA